MSLDNPLNSLSQKCAYLSYAVGGSLSELSFVDGKSKKSRHKKVSNKKASTKEDSKAKKRTPPAHGGGIRGTVKGFSRASRRRLLRSLASINRGVLRASRIRPIFLHLTFPAAYPEDAKACKDYLSAFHKRLSRRYGNLPGYWRMGIQKRGAFHFHLLLFLPPSAYESTEDFRRFVAESWFEVCGELCEEHLSAGTSVELVRDWRKVTSRAEKYLAKPEVFPEGVVTGRIWGVWHEELLPVQWETVEVSRKDAYKIRRFYRRLASLKSYGSLRRVIVFIEHETVLRLLKYLGYRQDEEPRTPMESPSRKSCSDHPVKNVAAQGAPRILPQILEVPETVGLWNTAASYALALARRTFSIVRKALHFCGWRRTLREGEKGGPVLVEGAEPSWWPESDLVKGLPTPAKVRKWWSAFVDSEKAVDRANPEKNGLVSTVSTPVRSEENAKGTLGELPELDYVYSEDE